MDVKAAMFVTRFFFRKALDMAHYIRLLYYYFETTKVLVRTAYEKRAPEFTSLEDENCEGQCYMVVGSTSDIGKEVCKYLVKKDSITLYALFHDQIKGDALLQSLKDITNKSSKVIPYSVDLSEPCQVIEFISTFIKEKLPLNVLINLAMKTNVQEKKNSLGTEEGFAVNVIAAYLLIRHFSKYMAESGTTNKKNRIISCVCGDILTVNLKFNDPELKTIPYKQIYFLSHQKKQIVVLTYFFAKEYSSIQYSSVIPGWVNTEGFKENFPEFLHNLRNDLRTPEQGADSILWLAISEESTTFNSGEVILDRKTFKSSYLNYSQKIKDPIYSMYLQKLESIVKVCLTPDPFLPKNTPSAEKSSITEKDSNLDTQKVETNIEPPEAI